MARILLLIFYSILFLTRPAYGYGIVETIKIKPEDLEEFTYNDQSYHLIGQEQNQIPYVHISDFARVVFYEDKCFRKNSSNNSCKYFISLIVSEKGTENSQTLYFVPNSEFSSSQCDAFQPNKDNVEPAWVKSLTESEQFFQQSFSKLFFENNMNCLVQEEIPVDDIKSRYYRFNSDELKAISSSSCVTSSKQDLALFQYIIFAQNMEGNDGITDNLQFAPSISDVLETHQ